MSYSKLRIASATCRAATDTAACGAGYGRLVVEWKLMFSAAHTTSFALANNQHKLPAPSKPAMACLAARCRACAGMLIVSFKFIFQQDTSRRVRLVSSLLHNIASIEPIDIARTHAPTDMSRSAFRPYAEACFQHFQSSLVPSHVLKLAPTSLRASFLLVAKVLLLSTACIAALRKSTRLKSRHSAASCSPTFIKPTSFCHL